ncbi:MAG: sugar phosphate nucleotidyltransferase, partial [Acidimicrobiia bacterium]
HRARRHDPRRHDPRDHAGREHGRRGLMLAVVLVGGFGTRLRPLTNDVPKPMLPVAHRPMIERLVERLAADGVTDVVLALGFRPEPFEAAFPGGRAPGVPGLRIQYAVEPEPLDTGGAIAFAARHAGVDDTFVVANGDVVTDVDIGRLVAEHRRIGLDATIHLTPVDDPSAFGVVETEGDVVRRFVEKPAPGETDSNLINAGTYVFEPAVLDLIGVGERVSIERVTFPSLVATGRLAAVPTDDYWLDTGRPELYLQANLDLITGVRGPAVDGIAPGAHVEPGATVVDSVVEAGATVCAGATVARSVLLAGAVIGPGTSVTESIVAGRTGSGATVERCVVGVGHQVGHGDQVCDERLPPPA